MKQYNPPELLKDAFDCPHCGGYSKQKWFESPKRVESYYVPSGINISQCSINGCLKYSIWHDKKMVYPRNLSVIPEAHQDLPSNLKKYYEEARLVASDSPRSALMLLRFIFEQFLQNIFNNKNKLHENIEKIDSEKLKKAINSIKIIGNKTTHYELNDIFKESALEVNQDLELICSVLEIAVEKYIAEEKKFEKIDVIKTKYDGVAKSEDKTIKTKP